LEKEFIKGGLRAAANYVIGFAIAWAAYLIFGWEYIHAPGIHHLIGLLVLIIGVFLLIRRLVGFFKNSSNSLNKGALLIHFVVIGGFGIYFLIFLNEVRKPNVPSEEELAEAEYLTTDENTESIIIQNGLGDTVFLQVDDSVLIDKKNYKE
jgi:hypothetical protein